MTASQDLSRILDGYVDGVVAAATAPLRAEVAAAAMVVDDLTVRLAAASAPEPDFVVGVTLPTPDNTGPRWAPVRTVHGDFRPESGRTYHRVRFEGRIIVDTSTWGVVFTDCWFVGDGPRSTDSALVNLEHATSEVRFERCAFTPAWPSPGWHAIRGRNYTCVRCRMVDVVDGAGVNVPGQVTVRLVGCYIGRLSYFSPCDYQRDGRTHCDDVQVQGGSGIDLLGCALYAFASDTAGNSADPTTPAPNPYHPSVTGQGLAVTPNAGKVTNLRVIRCWFAGGAQSVTILGTGYGVGTGVQLIECRFDTRTNPVIRKPDGVSARRAVLIAPTAPVDVIGCTDWDGSPVLVWRLPA